MSRQIVRWIVLVVGLGIGFGMVWRFRAILMPQSDAEQAQIILPSVDMGGENPLLYSSFSPPSTTDRLLRKVGQNRMISVNGKLYGPLESSLVGLQVEVENRDATIVVWSGQHEVGRFEQQ